VREREVGADADADADPRGWYPPERSSGVGVPGRASENDEFDRAAIELIEARLANPSPDDGRAALAKLRAVLDWRTENALRAAARQHAHVRAVGEARANEEEERRFIERMGGGDFERGLEEVERIRSEGEERRRRNEREAEKSRQLLDAEQRLEERDRLRDIAHRRGINFEDFIAQRKARAERRVRRRSQNSDLWS
jgi:hypothetical protein